MVDQEKRISYLHKRNIFMSFKGYKTSSLNYIHH